MTSKEAIEIIKKYDDDVMIRHLCRGVLSPKSMGSPLKEEFDEAVKVIEKDLEVLEIFKEKIKIRTNEKWHEYYLFTGDFTDNITLQLNENGNYDKFYKIKEWLEDE